MRYRMTLVVVTLILVAAACSSGEPDAGEASVDPGSPDTTQQTTTEPSQAAGDGDDPAGDSATGDSDEDVSAPAASGGGTATLELENGESFTFSILCALETQVVGGDEFLFVFVSPDRPLGLDVSQYGADSYGGAAVISIYDFDTSDIVWQAEGTLGAEVTLERNGNTITGNGVFLEGNERTGPGVLGELEANC